MPKEQWSTWFAGTERDWRALPMAEREAIAFAATRCAVAYPTWSTPVDCIHGGCRVLRGEIHARVLLNGALREEARSGWLKFTDRPYRARIFRHVRAEARRTGNYDMWAQWAAVVYGGVYGGLVK